MLVDLNDIVVHVMLPRVREFSGSKSSGKTSRRPNRKSRPFRNPRPRPQRSARLPPARRPREPAPRDNPRLQNMRVRIVAIGTRMPEWVTQAYEDYTRRLRSAMRIDLEELA